MRLVECRMRRLRYRELSLEAWVDVASSSEKAVTDLGTEMMILAESDMPVGH